MQLITDCNFLHNTSPDFLKVLAWVQVRGGEKARRGATMPLMAEQASLLKCLGKLKRVRTTDPLGNQDLEEDRLSVKNPQL